ncbi:MAG TPA: HAMP domain-containing sensor histidine kinase, partial [Burkholderiaceae bacterium]|nr:HAMP domain-containing sensor histidine kinase [Burkholderiaceae bacterium]
SASAAAGVVALLLLVGGVFVFRQELDRAVGAVRRTATRIADGDLRERVVVDAQDDEFARLGQDINAMLDRIESLMAGVRHVSDTIAHNLRTPLTRVLLGLRAAQAEGVPAAERQRAVATAIGELEELGTVFEKLLQIAEAEAGARRRNFAPVALHTIVGDVLELYDAVAEAQGATLQREAGDEKVVVPGDRDLLAGVVANLVDNALKYGGAGCTVVVGARWDDGRAVLTVRDDGPGVPAAERERIGTRFLRLMPELPGQGLGLASVRAVVALHGGRIGYADAGPGLIVRLEFPARG